MYPQTATATATATSAQHVHIFRPRSYTTELLDNENMGHLERAAELIAQGEIVAFGFNSVFAFIGDADQEMAAVRMAHAKGQSVDKTLALVCPPECLDEFVDVPSPMVHLHGMEKIQQLQRNLHGLGVILPVARTAVPRYARRAGTVLNVWFEMPPYSPARYLHERLRALGVRTMVGTSANQHGEATYVDPQQVKQVFGGRIAAIVSHDLNRIPMHRRVSSTLVDFTGELPRLQRRGSVPVEELTREMRRLGMTELCSVDGAKKPETIALLH